MENEQLLHSLEAVAGELAVQIRHEDLEGSRGGLFRLRGRVCILVDRNLSVSERVNLMARCLAQLPLDGVFMPPKVREMLRESSDVPLMRRSGALASQRPSLIHLPRQSTRISDAKSGP